MNSENNFADDVSLFNPALFDDFWFQKDPEFDLSQNKTEILEKDKNEELELSKKRLNDFTEDGSIVNFSSYENFEEEPDNPKDYPVLEKARYRSLTMPHFYASKKRKFTYESMKEAFENQPDPRIDQWNVLIGQPVKKRRLLRFEMDQSIIHDALSDYSPRPSKNGHDEILNDF